ncbi:globin-like [Mytilus trossulus]|uniref:globin-like n=1 Tax=Mytilus trossulus TaxID=6551 RepID=UPI0030061AD3
MSENGTNELLSEEEETAVKESWTVIWNDKKTNGIKIFVKLFTLYPDAISRFKDFNGLTLEEVKVHKKLRAHALSVIYALKSFIDNLDDVETLVELVKKNASNHVERKVTEKQIMWLKPVFIDILEEIMGDEMKDVHRTAWNKLFNAIKSLWKQEQDSVVAQQTEAS